MQNNLNFKLNNSSKKYKIIKLIFNTTANLQNILKNDKHKNHLIKTLKMLRSLNFILV